MLGERRDGEVDREDGGQLWREVSEKYYIH